MSSNNQVYVKCLNNSIYPLLEAGAIYTATEHQFSYKIGNFQYNKMYFMPVKLAVGAKVKCIKSIGPLVLGNIYTIFKIIAEYDNLVEIGLKEVPTIGTWYASRFEVISDNPTSTPITIKENSSSDLEEDRLRAIFLAPAPNHCVCGAVKGQCLYHP